MKYNSLLKENKIRPIAAKKEEIKELFNLAERDLKSAEFIITQDWDWGFAIAYNSVLQACRAFMFKEGFRPRSEESHKVTFEFMRIGLGKDHEDLINYFDRMRTKRHKALYEISGAVTETEVRQNLTRARDFVKLLKKLCMG